MPTKRRDPARLIVPTAAAFPPWAGYELGGIGWLAGIGGIVVLVLFGIANLVVDR
jgi:hypothetical protein